MPKSKKTGGKPKVYKKRGRKPKPKNLLADRVAQLEKQEWSVA